MAAEAHLADGLTLSDTLTRCHARAAWYQVAQPMQTAPVDYLDDRSGIVRSRAHLSDWFNENKETDWRIQSSPAAEAAFNEHVDDIGGVEYLKAQADSEAHAAAVGVVSEVIDVNHFTLVTHGLVEDGVPVGEPGTILYLSPDDAGDLTVTEPDPSDIIKPLAVILSAGEQMLFHNFRGAPDAPASTKGIVRLAGDLGGSAAAPTVPALANKADLSLVHSKSAPFIWSDFISE